MASHDQDWDLDDLGERIQDMIDEAIRSRNYQELNRNVKQTVNRAMNTGAEAMRNYQARQQTLKERQRQMQEDAQQRAAEAYRRNQAARARKWQQQYEALHPKVTVEPKKPIPESNLPVLYGSTTGRTLGGIFKAIGGGAVALVSTASVLFSALGAAFGSGALGTLITSSILLSGGAALLGNGISDITRMNRFDKYKAVLGDKTYAAINQLAQAVGKPAAFVRKDVQKLIGQKLFLEGHMDEDSKTLITSDETFEHYQQSRLQQEERKRLEAQEAKKAEARGPQVQEVLDKGNTFLREIKDCNGRIPGVDISEKISRMELIVQKIFERAESHPEIVPDLKKLMDYYLPMTVKLLNAYADMDQQPIQGETIAASKREIEGTLDTLNQAFEKLLDSVFKETAMDVSSDISVLQTLLAQEGLTDDELSMMKKKKQETIE